MRKAPYRIVDIPYKTQKRHFSTETVIFGQKKSACGKPPARKGPKGQLFLQKKQQKTLKSSRNGHPWVEIGRRPYQNDQKSKIYKNPIEFLRQNLKNEGLRRILGIDFFAILGPINKIERAIYTLSYF